VVCAAAAAISVVLRFGRSQGVERQQLKWFTYAATLMVLFMVLSDFLLPQSGVVDALYGFVVALSRSPPGSRSCAIGCTTSTG
jgi:hypothetical protein